MRQESNDSPRPCQCRPAAQGAQSRRRRFLTGKLEKQRELFPVFGEPETASPGTSPENASSRYPVSLVSISQPDDNIPQYVGGNETGIPQKRTSRFPVTISTIVSTSIPNLSCHLRSASFI